MQTLKPWGYHICNKNIKNSFHIHHVDHGISAIFLRIVLTDIFLGLCIRDNINALSSNENIESMGISFL